tara:strand:- start:1410 stop:1814 length:405 start_codon:yes stop_codon:yes gene_type:complete
MDNLFLIYINKIGQNWKGEYIYEFIFSDNIKDVDGEGWDSYPASSTPEPPETKFIQEVGTLKATLNLDVIQDSQSFAVWDAVDGIIALAWENLDNYEEYPDSRLSFNFGAEKNKVTETLYEKDLFLKFEKTNAL